MDERIKERMELAAGRVREIALEYQVPEPFGEYFRRMGQFLGELLSLRDVCRELRKDPEKKKRISLEEFRMRNYRLYQDILPENYGKSYGNPEYAVRQLGKELGPLLSFLYTELRGMIVYAYEGRDWDFLVCMELFLQVYGEFPYEEVPSGKQIRELLYWYVNDYCQEMIAYRLSEQLDPCLDFPLKIIMEEDLSDPRYLYAYGEYVTEEEERTAEFLHTFSQEDIRQMASTFTRGYQTGFLVTGKDIRKKKTVNIRYRLGFERMVREAVYQFREMGLEPVIYRSASHVVNKRQHMRIGYTGAEPNQQYLYDHRNDAALFLDEDFVGRKLRAIQKAYDKRKELAAVHGGPAVIEVFGETPFTLEPCPYSMVLDDKQKKLQVRLDNQAGQITNRYLPGRERSFTIIAYPVPGIGKNFPQIFQETVAINTLDSRLYQQIQQIIIDVLDQGKLVKVTGKGANCTDLTIMLHQLTDPVRQTNFENCVADVNIPVGEVFTSPQLSGTRGTLHVSSVYLDGLLYQDLILEFREGKITEYSCGNFPDPAVGKQYILENILSHHKTLPMGEFAIGTNTAAYKMAEMYGIQEQLPILIAEKMGPHFAVGDTCYCWAEDTPVYNPDGKEIIARDNEISLRRKEEPEKAYFGCHTDITISYRELDAIRVVREDGTVISVIEDGKFVLPGTEELNRPLEELEKYLREKDA